MEVAWRSNHGATEEQKEEEQPEVEQPEDKPQKGKQPEEKPPEMDQSRKNRENQSTNNQGTTEQDSNEETPEPRGATNASEPQAAIEMTELPAELPGKLQAKLLAKLTEVGAIEIRNLEGRHDNLSRPLEEIKKEKLKPKRL